MNDQTSTARRYHWLSEHVTSFVDEPHDAICCDVRGDTLNLVASESAGVRRASAELASLPPDTTLQAIAHVPDLRLPARHLLFPSSTSIPVICRRFCWRPTSAHPKISRRCSVSKAWDQKPCARSPWRRS